MRSCASGSKARRSTIFGATQPRALATTAMDALEAASNDGEFYYHVRKTDFGPYVDQIGRYAEDIPAASGWAFKVNGASPPVGRRHSFELKAGDVVLWYWATFSNAGGPSTLELTRTANGCYRVRREERRRQCRLGDGDAEGRRTPRCDTGRQRLPGLPQEPRAGRRTRRRALERPAVKKLAVALCLLCLAGLRGVERRRRGARSG